MEELLNQVSNHTEVSGSMVPYLCVEAALAIVTSSGLSLIDARGLCTLLCPWVCK